MLTLCGDSADPVNPAACWTGSLAVRSGVVVVVSIFYVMLTLTFALSVFQQDPTDRSDALGRPHSRIEVFSLFFKTVLTVSFTVLQRDER